MIEIFKQILEIPKYEVSNFGNVRTIYRGELKKHFINKLNNNQTKNYEIQVVNIGCIECGVSSNVFDNKRY